jgi:hypothetical protein
MNDDKRSKDETAMLALACGATVDKAAQQAKLSKRTLYRRLAQPAFRRRVQAARAEMLQRTAGTATAATPAALKANVELFTGSSSDAVRLGAARSVMEIALKLREITDLEERLSALEQKIDGDTGNGSRP